MKFKNLFLFLILLVVLISACNQTSSPQPSATSFQPVAWLTGQPGAVNLTPTEGNGPFQCAITAGALPQGFNLNNCVISGTAPVLAGGTTKSVSPPFTIIITNAAGQQQILEYNILTVASLPEIIFNEPGACIVKQKCNVNLIAQVNGGTPPYHFQSDTFRNGAPPMGMIVDVNGVLTGIPSKTGQYTFGVCVVDVVAASKCGQTSVFVIDEEEIEEIISYSESGGLCSSNADCISFAQNNCDASENVRCSSDGLCHCCLTLCPGGENCKCIDCSTGCGGGTYCEGDVCVFEAGGTINEEQTTETVSTTPKEEPKDVPETWSGTITETANVNFVTCTVGKLALSYSVTLNSPVSLVSALRGQQEITLWSKPNFKDTSGTIKGTATVTQQTKCDPNDYETYTLIGGSSNNVPIVFFAVGGQSTYIQIAGPPNEVDSTGTQLPSFGSYQIYRPLVTDADKLETKNDLVHFPIVWTVTSISDNEVSGVVSGTGQVAHDGTFKLTKQ